MTSILARLVFPSPPIFMNALSAITFIAISALGLLELSGKHLQYSKFWRLGSQKSAANRSDLSSRTGMLLLYTPAFLAGLASFLVLPLDDFRFVLVDFTLTLHFFKRVFEVLFIHRYSGGMAIDSTILISLSYFSSIISTLYAQYLTKGLIEPQIDLKYIGVVLFLIGISGNFYHHLILSRLRRKDEKGYKIPKGGLFGVVICPHYLFEIIQFFGVSFISQTIHAFSFTIASMFYLMGRSYVTRKWYLSKFEDFPKDVKALVPFVY